MPRFAGITLIQPCSSGRVRCRHNLISSANQDLDALQRARHRLLQHINRCNQARKTTAMAGLQSLRTWHGASPVLPMTYQLRQDLRCRAQVDSMKAGRNATKEQHIGRKRRTSFRQPPFRCLRTMSLLQPIICPMTGTPPHAGLSACPVQCCNHSMTWHGMDIQASVSHRGLELHRAGAQQHVMLARRELAKQLVQCSVMLDKPEREGREDDPVYAPCQQALYRKLHQVEVLCTNRRPCLGAGTYSGHAQQEHQIASGLHADKTNDAAHRQYQRRCVARFSTVPMRHRPRCCADRVQQAPGVSSGALRPL